MCTARNVCKFLLRDVCVYCQNSCSSKSGSFFEFANCWAENENEIFRWRLHSTYLHISFFYFFSFLLSLSSSSSPACLFPIIALYNAFSPCWHFLAIQIDLQSFCNSRAKINSIVIECLKLGRAWLSVAPSHSIFIQLSFICFRFDYFLLWMVKSLFTDTRTAEFDFFRLESPTFLINNSDESEVFCCCP